MSIKVLQFAVGGFDKNFSYTIADAVSREAFIVDPTGDFVMVMSEIGRHQYHVIGILLTHTHHDHYEKLDVAVSQYHSPVYFYNTGQSGFKQYDDIRYLADDQCLQLGSGCVMTIHTPGHIDDAMCYFISAEHADDGIPKVITGDTLFVGGCGRTNEQRVKDLYESLAELGNLPDETIVYPGHDYGLTPTSTIGHEKQCNKYYQVKNFNEFVKLRLG